MGCLPPQLGTISPSSGSSLSDQLVYFTTVYSDPDGWNDIQYVHLLINTAVNGTNCFYGYYNQNNNKLYLRNNANNSWLGGFIPGSNNAVENSYAKLDCSKTTVSGKDKTLTVKWAVMFKPTFRGVKNTYLYAKDDMNIIANWVKKGTWEVKADTIVPIGTIKINNDNSYVNSTQVTLTLSAQDNSGGSGLDKMQFSNNNSVWSTPEAYTATKSWTLFSDDGTKTVYVKFSDKAGNWSIAYSDSIILDTNNIPPEVTSIQPENSSIFLAGAKINITISATDFNNDPLQYQFLIGGTIKQAWSSANTYIWQTQVSDTSTVSIACGIRDNRGGEASTVIVYSIINPTVQDVLKKVADNYAKIYDFTANMTLSSTLNNQPFGETEYCKYYFKSPNKEKTETYSDTYRATKTDVIVVDGANMHLIDPINNIKQQVDLLADADVTAAQFNQMDIYYNQANFLDNHTVAKNDTDTDFINAFVALDVFPKTSNNIYDKLGILIDYFKGVIAKYSIYKKNESNELELIQETKTIEYLQMPNGVWLPSKMVKTPKLTEANLVSTLTYDNLQVNTGLVDLDFDPEKQ